MAAVLLSVCGVLASQGQGAVKLFPIAALDQYPDATAPSALQLACSEEVNGLSAFFHSRDLPFDKALAKKRKKQTCHIYYEPTIRGFRASADNDPVSGLHVDVNVLSFLSLRTEQVGDALDIAKILARDAPPRVRMEISVSGNDDQRWFDQALQHHFPAAGREVKLEKRACDVVNSFAQDYLKAGEIESSPVVLLPRLLYEGDASNGESLRPLLDSLSTGNRVRSKLSWDGGDLQFIRNPKHPERLILFYGDSARDYWGAKLSIREYEYVLKLEFGADDALDFSGLMPHVDYFVSILPRDNIALVAQPVRTNRELARAALDVLLETYCERVPDELRRIDRLVTRYHSARTTEYEELANLLTNAIRNCSNWPLLQDLLVTQQMDAYVMANCPDNPTECFQSGQRERMLTERLGSMRLWTTAALKFQTSLDMTPRLLTVIENQMLRPPVIDTSRVASRIKLLQGYGFRVVRVPFIEGIPDGNMRWAGVSYANSLLVDNTLFVPEFGLGAAEKALHEKIAAGLPADYKVVPIFARQALLRNGGIHCIAAVERCGTSAKAAGARRSSLVD